MLRCAREANQHLIDFTVVRAGASDYMRREEIFSPMGSIVLLDLMGGVALLLWGLHMVLSGVLRAYGPDLRRTLSKALGNRFTALGAGLGLTALLQSSTATGLMTASLAADGVVSLVPALAIMLGANVGTTLIVQVLSFNISAIAPVLFVVGLVTFRVGGGSLTKALGRVAIGLGLTLLALHILLDTLAPAEQAPAVRALLATVTTDPVLCVIIAAALTWAAHSSVAVVLLVMSLAYSQFVTEPAALALVLGANLGSAINPLIEAGVRGDPASRRLPVGNMLNRLVGVLIALPFLQPIARELATLQPDAAKMTAEFHMLFNVALAALFIGALDAVAWLLVRILPEKKLPPDASVPRYLDETALETPPLALANAARETLRMGDAVETMLRDVMAAIMTNDRKLASDVSKMDNVVDRLNEAIKLYVTKLTRDALDDREGRRAMEIVSFTINLEHIGDIIDKNLCELAAKKIKRRYQFSAEGAAELTAFHKRVLECLQSAFGIFMTGDAAAARKLLREKADMRRAELEAADRHFERLREGRPESLETTSLHLDILSDLKRIHSHICSVAYPVLEAAGELPTRDGAKSDAATDALTFQSKTP
jgi:phosphate:Na+ symporter